MSAASKKSKTQQLKERWENGELDCGAMTPEFIKGLSPRELGMLGELITIDYFNERGYTLLEQGYRCSEGEADLVLLDELMKIEAELGRDRSKKAKANGPRTIDLDLLWMDGETHGGKKLRLPHPLIGSAASQAAILWSIIRSRRFASMPWVSPFAAGISPRSSISTTRSIGRCRDGVRDVCRSRGLHPWRRGDSRHGRGLACRRRSGHSDARHSEYGGDGVTRSYSLRDALRRV